MAWDIIQSASESESTDEETSEYNHVYNWRTYIRPKKKRNRPEEDVVQKKKKKKKENYYYDNKTKKLRKRSIYNTIWRGGLICEVFSEGEEKKRREESKKKFWWRYRHCGGDSIEKVRTATQMSKQLLLKGIQHEEMSEYELISNLAGTTARTAAMKHGSVVRAILALQSS